MLFRGFGVYGSGFREVDAVFLMTQGLEKNEKQLNRFYRPVRSDFLRWSLTRTAPIVQFRVQALEHRNRRPQTLIPKPCLKSLRDFNSNAKMPQTLTSQIRKHLKQGSGFRTAVEKAESPKPLNSKILKPRGTPQALSSSPRQRED